MATSLSNLRGLPRKPNGFIVVAVLWMLAGLSALVSVYAAYVIQTTAGVSIYDDQLRARAVTSAAVELSVYRQLAQPAQYRSTSGAFSFRLGDASASVSFLSEAARVDLNAAPKPLLVGLFTALGAKPEAAENYAERVIGWRSPIPPDGGKETAVYDGLGYGPRGAKFPHVNELSLIRGLPEALIERALPYVTVFSGRPQINVFEAAPEVIAALPGLSREQVAAVVALRAAPLEAKRHFLKELGPAQQFVSLEPHNAVRNSVEVGFRNGYRAKSEVVVFLAEQGNDPFSVLSWREGLDEIMR